MVENKLKSKKPTNAMLGANQLIQDWLNEELQEPTYKDSEQMACSIYIQYTVFKAKHLQ